MNKIIKNLLEVNSISDLKLRCFWCLKKIPNGENSKEHIFPRWLLKKMRLFDMEVNAKNDLSTAKLGKLKIKCCKNCNNSFLGKAEEEIRDYVNGDKLKPRRELAQRWLGKIILGLAYFRITTNNSINDFEKFRITWAGIHSDNNTFKKFDINSLKIDSDHFNFFIDWKNYGSILVTLGNKQLSLIVFMAPPAMEIKMPKNPNYLDLIINKSLIWTFSFSEYGNIIATKDIFFWDKYYALDDEKKWEKDANKMAKKMLSVVAPDKKVKIKIEENQIEYKWQK